MKQTTFRPMNTIEILGAPVAFNSAYEAEYSRELNETFLYCEEALHSTTSTNGYVINLALNHDLSHLEMSTNDILFAVCYDSEGDEVYYKVESNGLYLINEV